MECANFRFRLVNLRVTNIGAFALRVGLLVLLLKALSSKHAILAISLSVGVAETIEAGALFPAALPGLLQEIAERARRICRWR